MTDRVRHVKYSSEVSTSCIFNTFSVQTRGGARPEDGGAGAGALPHQQVLVAEGHGEPRGGASVASRRALHRPRHDLRRGAAGRQLRHRRTLRAALRLRKGRYRRGNLRWPTLKAAVLEGCRF